MKRWSVAEFGLWALATVWFGAGGMACLEESGGVASDSLSENEEVAEDPAADRGIPAVMVSPRLGPLAVESPGVDVAAWIHPSDPSRSLLFLATSAGRIHVYDFQGELLQVVDLGLPGGESPAIGGVDVRRGFRYRGESIDIVAANLSAEGKLAVLRIHPDAARGQVVTVLADQRSRRNSISPGSHAFALYRRPADGSVYVIDQSRVSGSTPSQYLIREEGGEIVTSLVRTFDDRPWTLGSGFIADDELGFAYLGEEQGGVHKYQADPESNQLERLAVFATDDAIGGAREGLALYPCSQAGGYLILATEDYPPLSGAQPTSSRFLIYDRQEPGRPLKAFLAAGSIHTSGLAAASKAVPGFPGGFVALQVSAGSGRDYFVYDWREIAGDDLTICP